MKLLTMKCIYDPEQAETGFSYGKLGEEEYFVKFEDNYEDDIYSDMSNECNDNDYADFNRWLKDNLDVTDYDVYMYFMASEPEPAVGDTYTDANSLIWERTEHGED